MKELILGLIASVLIVCLPIAPMFYKDEFKYPRIKQTVEEYCGDKEIYGLNRASYRFGTEKLYFRCGYEDEHKHSINVDTLVISE